ncbi:MAG: protein kinase domain-containing protein [Pirellula sp.]|jgi:serine/threonine protein kinase|nr:protein kinase [Pirellula sp.]
MKIATECPTNHQLKAFTLGQLSNDDSDALFQHISDCDRCRSELETVEDARDSLIVSLRDPVEYANFRAEPECQLAVVKALGALANSDNGQDRAEFDRLPKTIGEYDILRPIGSGGMGKVFLARHTKLGREVALKVLANHRLADSRTVERFEAEMRAIGRLSHPNIVTAFDAREVDGTAVLVTEFISGLDLGQLLQRTGALGVADACEITRQVAVALSYTNSQGFVHRDVKPSNVMLSNDGEVKLLDLGLARLQYGDHERSELTGTGQAMGSADYISPEQVADSKTVDIRADIYSLGCTLFKLLTGRAPFADDQHLTTFAKMTAHVSQSPPSLADLLPSAPRSLVQLVDSMLAKKPSNRPSSPQDIVVALAPHCKEHNLKRLIHDALLLEPVKHSISSTSTVAKPATQSWMKRPVPTWKAIAAGFFGLILGMCFSIIVVITNPDGSKTTLQLAEGSKVEIREGLPNPKKDIGATESRGNSVSGSTLDSTSNNSDVTPLSFGILVNRESTGHAPSVSEVQIQEATRLLRASEGNNPVRTPYGTWYAVADEKLSAPFKEMNAGKRFVLVSNDHSIRWPNIRGHILSAKTKGEKRETSIELSLDPELGSLFASLTKANIRNQLAIVVNGIVRSAPIINAEIGQQVSITGIFERSEARQLGLWLQEGMVAPVPEVSTDLDKNSSMEPFLKTYKLTQIAPKIAYDIVASLLNGNPNVKLAVDEQNQTLILLAGPTEHELIEKTLTELMGGNAAQTENVSAVTGLKQQLLELAGQLGEDLTNYGHQHPTVLITQRKIGKVQAQIQELQMSEKTKEPKSFHEAKLLDLNNKLELLGFAFLNFESAYKKFPGTSNTREGGQNRKDKKTYPFSWRVAILPFIEQVELYQQYHFDEPWDSEHNLTLLDKMPAVYRSLFANESQKPGETNFVGFASMDSALGLGGGEQLQSFTDGTSPTLLLVEAANSVPWTKPYDFADPSQVVWFDDHPSTFLMADGRVRSEKISTEELLKLISRNGGEAVK